MLRDICENSVIRAELTMYIATGPAVHEDNESFQFYDDIIRYAYCTYMVMTG